MTQKATIEHKQIFHAIDKRDKIYDIMKNQRENTKISWLLPSREPFASHSIWRYLSIKLSVLFTRIKFLSLSLSLDIIRCIKRCLSLVNEVV